MRKHISFRDFLVKDKSALKVSKSYASPDLSIACMQEQIHKLGNCSRISCLDRAEL